MRAAVLKEYGEPLVVENRPKPDCADEGVVVELAACGVCRSDWHAWQGDWGWLDAKPPTDHILGHEPAGTVVAAGPETERIREGDEVAIPFNLADGACHRCHADRSHLCENRVTPGFSPEQQGAFAEQIHVPHADFNLAELPDGATAADMASLGCRFMTAYHALVHRADASVGDWVSVHGCGGIGLSAIHIAHAQGLRTVAVDINEDALAMAEELGADATVNAAEREDVPGEVHAVTNGGADISVDALGIAETCRNSVLSLGPFGQHVQIGLTSQAEQGMVSLPTDLITGQELEFIGSKGMQPNRYGELIDLVDRGDLDPTRIISERIGLEDTPDTLAAMTDYETQGIPVITAF